ncbi:hypothetical protein [Microbacterium nymphoidis]|uniref:hypothetical protein n=1 Tax=Microbacterium nymphoidis TaxID=2898586 RepID=UPI001E2DE941|nr:hypothetical protein [Microbacterium nymphoidis]MCD2497827.1 hypothetical protein [Microbacterium nymphoidis]
MAAIRSLAVTGLVALLVLPACSAVSPGNVQSCIDWVVYDSIEDAQAQSDAIVLAVIGTKTGDIEFMRGAPATTWSVDVRTWLEAPSGVSATDTIEVVSTPYSCGETRDALGEAADGEPRILFLRDGDHGWEILTPYQGVALPGPDGSLPTAWPSPS